MVGLSDVDSTNGETSPRAIPELVATAGAILLVAPIRKLIVPRLFRVVSSPLKKTPTVR